VDKEDIIRMAKEARMPYFYGTWEIANLDGLERFAALVAAHERKKVAKWMVERSFATGHGDTIEDLLREIDWQAAEREREGYRQGYADAMNWKTQNHLEHLPGREWVGLTDEEIKNFVAHLYPLPEKPVIDRLQVLEAKLREKNGG